MALNSFIPASLAGWVAAAPNLPVRFEDLNADNILLIFEKSWVNPDTQVNSQVIHVEVCEGGSTAVGLTRTQYIFPIGATITDLDAFLALVDYYAPDNKLEKYTDLVAIDNSENVITTRDALVNNDKVVRKVYLAGADQTVFFCNAMSEVKYKQLYFDGDKTNAESAYELYG